MSGSRKNNNGSFGRQGPNSNDEYRYPSYSEGSPGASAFSASSGGHPASMGYTLDYYQQDHQADPASYTYAYGQARSDTRQQYVESWEQNWQQLGGPTRGQGQDQGSNMYDNRYGSFSANMNGYADNHGQNSGVDYSGAARVGFGAGQDQVGGYAGERRFVGGEENGYEDGDLGGPAQPTSREKDGKKSKGKNKSNGSGSGKHRKHRGE